MTLPQVLIICGPTASGKSELALRLATELGGEIINADSMQVYRGMTIGTAKPSDEHRRVVPHHLLDSVTPDINFSAADYKTTADGAIRDIISRGKRVVVVGGTGLYIRALLQGLVDSPGDDGGIRLRLQEEAEQMGNDAMLDRLRQVDPELAARLHPNNLVRIIRALEVFEATGVPLSRHQQEHGFGTDHYTSLQIGIRVERSELYRRIEQRVDQMVTGGLVEEVRGLLERGYGRELKSMRAIGYKEIAAYLAGETTLEEAVELMKRDTRRYAKRQMTWFNGDPRIIWLEYPEKFATISQLAHEFFNFDRRSDH